MRTIGEILKKIRSEKRLTLEEIEKQLRIRKKFLIALEENDWSKLPSLPYIKGFLKNYSSFLGLKSDEMLAIFRRQFHQQEKAGLLPKGLTNPLDEPIIRFTPQLTSIILSISFLVVFFGYLFLQYLSFVNPPELSIESPKEGEIITSEKVTVKGKSDRDAVISVNNQKIALSENGEFTTTLTLSPGVNTINIESASKQGKKRTITRTIQIME